MSTCGWTEIVGNISEFVSAIGILVGIGFGIKQILILKNQIKLNFYADYTKRYQQIMLNLPLEINKKKFQYADLTTDQKKTTLRYMRAYFDLCSEEYFLSKKNLDKEVWEEWEQGIIFTINKSAFRYAWKKLNKDSRFYPEFSCWLESKLSDC